jgi:hypothetical protein
MVPGSECSTLCSMFKQLCSNACLPAVCLLVDYGVICASEQNVIVEDEVRALQQHDTQHCTAQQACAAVSTVALLPTACCCIHTPDPYGLSPAVGLCSVSTAVRLTHAFCLRQVYAEVKVLFTHTHPSLCFVGCCLTLLLSHMPSVAGV